MNSLLSLIDKSPDGFINMFYKVLNENPCTQEEAYEVVESLMTANFGRRRYADFNSFRNVRDNRYKSKK
jgi:hypothetical protein